MSSDRYIVSAPGKVILFGEHAVVYGKTAIAGSLDKLRTYAFFEKRIDGYLELNLTDLGLQRAFLWPASALPYSLVNNVDVKEPQKFNEVLLHKIKSIAFDGQDNQEINNFQQIAAFTFLYLYTCLDSNSQTSWSGMTINVRSNVPVGKGLGSSASYSVCLATGLLLAFGHILSPRESNEQDIKKTRELINLWAYQAEKVIHGTPSGVDNSVATYGGVIMFTSGVIQNIMGTFESTQSLRFLLTDTKVPRNTKILIENVRTRIENFPKIGNLILDAIHGVSESFKEILESEMVGDQEQCTKTEGLIDMCHYLLNSLGVGHPSLDKVREIAAQCDLHTKLTGAGGGGCALTLIRNDVSKAQIEIVKKALTASPHCFECYETSIGGHGVGVLDASSGMSLQEFSECEKNQLAEIIGWMYFA